MTIDRLKLIDLLIEKTSLSKKDVESQLDQLIEKILDAAGKGKALEIKEFGLFFFDQNGELRFEPSEELSTEISFKYAGMKPVEIKPERSTRIVLDEEVASSLDSSEDVVFVPKKTTSATPIKSESSTKTQTKTVRKKSAPRKKDRSAVYAILAFLMVLIIGGIIYINHQAELQREATLATAVQSPQETEFSGAPESATEDGLPADDQEESGLDEPEEQIEFDYVQDEQEIYGLTGNLIDEANNGYSIVIHSFYNELRANNVAEGLREEGYRTLVSSRIVGGLDVYRVSLGQFATIADAQEAAETLPDPYNDNYFIQRIQ